MRHASLSESLIHLPGALQRLQGASRRRALEEFEGGVEDAAVPKALEEGGQPTALLTLRYGKWQAQAHGTQKRFVWGWSPTQSTSKQLERLCGVAVDSKHPQLLPQRNLSRRHSGMSAKWMKQIGYQISAKTRNEGLRSRCAHTSTVKRVSASLCPHLLEARRCQTCKVNTQACASHAGLL